MIQYMIHVPVTDYIQSKFDKMFSYIKPKRKELKCQNKYL